MSPEPPTPELTSRLKFFTRAGTLLGLFLAALDQTIAFTAAIERIYRVCIGIALLGLLLTLALPEIPLRRTLSPPPIE